MRYFSFLALFFIFRNGFTQISPVYAKHYIYEQFINPAITGRDYYPVVNFSHKKYWLGTDESPGTTCFGASMRLGSYNFYTPKMMLNKSKWNSKGRMGIGGFVMHETDGPLRFTNGILTYSYFVPFNEGASQLSFGLSLQLSHYSINRGILSPLNEDDPYLFEEGDNTLIPESGFGVYYHTDQFYAGASVNDLFLSELPFNNSKVVNNKRDFFLQSGYKFFLKYVEVEPSLFCAIINDRPLYYFGQFKLYYRNYNWVAVAYKSTKSVLLSAGFRLQRFYFAYVYDQSVSSMVKYYQGSHEIMIGLNIGLYEKEGIRKVTRNNR